MGLLRRRRPIPRRALVGAMLGALYALLLLAPIPGQPFSWPGLGWFLLSMGLLFLTPIAYHVYTTWGIVWVLWRCVSFYREGGFIVGLALDILLPVLSLALLMSSDYLPLARAARDGESSESQG